MTTVAGIGFLEPWLLVALLALPILWWLLRAVPPSPLTLRFPAVVLLMGLRDADSTPERTPWWLLLLRLTALTLLIVGFAGPVINPEDRAADNKLHVVALDASWASAADWDRRQQRVAELLRQAETGGRPVALVRWTDPPPSEAALAFTAGVDALSRAAAMNPLAWRPRYAAWADALENAAHRFDTFWITDGLAHDEESRARLAAILASRGRLRVIGGSDSQTALRNPRIDDGRLAVTALRLPGGERERVAATASGPGPDGLNRILAREEAWFEDGSTETEVSFDLPTEIRNRVRQIRLLGRRSAGAVVVTDDAVRRRRVALFGGSLEQEGSPLLSPLHYLRQALGPTADIIETDLSDALQSDPDVVILADVGNLSADATEHVSAWVADGGLLVQFAGPRLASSDVGRFEEHQLLPVRLRAGGRSVGGAMSWGDPKRLRAFPPGSPFSGLPVPDDVVVNRQVMAQPDHRLAGRVLASLQDGTPLVTARDEGMGRIVLFHVSADVQWSNLPISGLFVDMLRRLAVSAGQRAATAQDLLGQYWTPVRVIDAFGIIRPEGSIAAVDGALISEGEPAPGIPPGVYASSDRAVALNVLHPSAGLEPAAWPADVRVLPLNGGTELDLKPWFIAAALLLLCADAAAVLVLTGRATRLIGPAAALAVATVLSTWGPGSAAAGDRERLAANNTVLAYVITKDQRQDAISAAGLLGLSTILHQRTSIEPVEPVAVDVEQDELAVYPLLYWPVTAGQASPGGEAARKLDRYLRTGGVILFDTLDSGDGGASERFRHLRRLTATLDIPPLEPAPADHVLTRSFYLLQDFPGRHAGSDVWVEAAPADAGKLEGVPFRNLNDGVSPVIIGGNDWASAWAIGRDGRFLFPVGSGAAGQRQRELAYRFGVNLVMYVLTGNYKSDQVHVPALLERLGQ